MSVRMMSLVWELELPDSEKLVLLALADCANDEGHCWPGMATLVRKCSKSDRTVQLAIKGLCVRGHLTRREVPGKGCNYTVHPIVRFATGETHYLYRTEDTATGEFYIGARSCFDAPDTDAYLGSGAWVKAALESGRQLKKTVLNTFASREGLALAEQAATAAVFGQKLCRNRKIATPETLSPRDRITPKPLPQTPEETSPTPEAASGKPSKNHKEPSKGSRKRALQLPDWIPEEPWLAFVQMRRATPRVPFTDAAARGIITDLDRLRAEGHDVGKVLLKSVKLGWRGVFGDDDTKGTAAKLTPAEQIASLETTAAFFEKINRADDAADCRRKIAKLRAEPEPERARRSAPIGSIVRSIVGRAA